MRLLIVIVSMMLFSVSSSPLSAEEKNDYRHIFLLGVEKSISNSRETAHSPMIAYYYIRNDLRNDLYIQFTLTTTTLYFIMGEKTGNYFAGIKPILNHTIYGAYNSYTNGVNDDGRCLKGNNFGAEIFYEYLSVKYLKARISYYPGYYLYQKKNKSKFIFTRNDGTEIDLPENHWEHSVTLDLTAGNLEKKDINRIWHGFVVQAIYNYSYRSGYGTFYDTAAAEDSSINRTHKRYLNAGVYFNLAGDINPKLDIYGAYHTNTDRNNAEQIGGYIADKGIMPGYYWGEFYHNRYLITRMQTGVPLPFWRARLQPGFNILYMPHDNEVTGMEDYP